MFLTMVTFFFIYIFFCFDFANFVIVTNLVPCVPNLLYSFYKSFWNIADFY